jgi:ribosomal protein S27AE
MHGAKIKIRKKHCLKSGEESDFLMAHHGDVGVLTWSVSSCGCIQSDTSDQEYL